MSWQQRAAAALARRGFVVSRHPAARRQRLLERHGVDLVLDVGAAHGAYGEQLRAFGYRGEIVSFEPLAAPFVALSARCAGDAAWSCRQLALGSSAGTASINVASNSDSSSLLPMLAAHRDAAPQVDYVGSESVTVSTLDASVGDLAARRVFLKIDTQGFEREVLAGAPRVVAALVGLQLELSFVPLYDGAMLADEAIGWAYSHGFVLTGFEQGFAGASGELLQADGVFFRLSESPR